MPHNLKMKAGRAAQVGLEGQRFFLFMPVAQQPVDRHGSWPELYGDVSIFEAARRELQASMQAGTVLPLRVEDASFAGAGRLYPAQRFGSFVAVVGGEEEIPRSQDRNRADHVND